MPSAIAESDLAGVVAEVAHWLPAQGPIGVFIHHNTLHAFEHLGFEDAVVAGGKTYGCAPFLAVGAYRREIARGRILEADVTAVLADELGESERTPVAGVDPLDLRRRIAMYGLRELRGSVLAWTLSETPALERFRRDVPPDAEHARLQACEGRRERDVVAELWSACTDAVRLVAPARRNDEPVAVRHRDIVWSAARIDIDEWVHPVLIRFVSAFLDQGVASWSMPDRERGLYECFAALYGAKRSRWIDPWTRALYALIEEDRAERRTPLASLAASLRTLGVEEREAREFLTRTALALRGYAGIVHQFEARPDRVPSRAVPARLVDFFAVRLLLERAALAHAARLARYDRPLDALRKRLGRRAQTPPIPEDERAWMLLQLAGLMGWRAYDVAKLDASSLTAIEREILHFSDVAQRRVLHLAYERRFRERAYDALVQHSPYEPTARPEYQAVFCLDEREESLRRHLEEVDANVETLGAAGFFGIAMYYQGANDAHSRPSCPVAVRPEHFVAEVFREPAALQTRLRRLRRRGAGEVSAVVHGSSGSLVRGALVTALLGTLAIIPLVLRVVFPWLRTRIAHAALPFGSGSSTMLALDRLPSPRSGGAHAGFTVEEQAAIVRALLENAGFANRLAPLVLLIGHGSSSLNNPQESAHDCGACGGGHGGPNARAFAQMANDTRVREHLTKDGLIIDSTTWFVGAERNSCSSEIVYFDVDGIPDASRTLFDHAKSSLDTARAREAHERCRRFDAAGSGISPSAALAHVEARSEDLAQPRPEYGHATNALCVVGRRARTRGLFLDRRSFLTSYDPTKDGDGRLLEQLLGAIVPVMAGINLEYYFGFVDPVGYGCGTKLPHNITGLIGVMDGAQSDLRTGLPWQMLEIHEPVRLTLVVECTASALQRSLDAHPAIARLIENRWMFLARLDPRAVELREWKGGTWVKHAVKGPLPVVLGTSIDCYRGLRGPVAPREIHLATSPDTAP